MTKGGMGILSLLFALQHKNANKAKEKQKQKKILFVACLFKNYETTLHAY